MNDDQPNPPPRQSELPDEPQQDPTLLALRVRNGRIIYLAVCLFFVLTELRSALSTDDSWQPFRVFVVAVLFVAGWYGRQGALLALVGYFLLLAFLGVSMLVNNDWLGLLAIVVSLGMVVLFIRSRSLNAFFRHQRGIYGPPPDDGLDQAKSELKSP